MVASKAPLASKWSAKQLPDLPQFLRTLIAKARADLGTDKIVIFGSRARGDHIPQSDYDLCFYNERSKTWTEQKWARFVVDFDESKETLCAIDFVNYADAHTGLRSEIDKTGVVLYERG
jgi:predicted nucleotidyltransferase